MSPPTHQSSRRRAGHRWWRACHHPNVQATTGAHVQRAFTARGAAQQDAARGDGRVGNRHAADAASAGSGAVVADANDSVADHQAAADNIEGAGGDGGAADEQIGGNHRSVRNRLCALINLHRSRAEERAAGLDEAAARVGRDKCVDDQCARVEFERATADLEQGVVRGVGDVELTADDVDDARRRAEKLPMTMLLDTATPPLVTINWLPPLAGPM